MARAPADPVDVVLRRRDALVTAITTAASDRLDGPAAGRATEAAVALLPAGCQYDATFRSISSAASPTPPRPDVVRTLAWALAGDPQGLKAGRPVFPVHLPTTPTRVTLQVLAAAPLPTPKRAATATGQRVRYRMRVLVGVGTPLTIETVWSSKFVAYLAAHPRGFGFRGRVRPGRAVATHPFRHWLTLVGMRLTAAVSVTGDGRVDVAEPRCTPGQRRYNQALTAMRHREGYACPFGFTHHCQDCPKGQATCPAAVRPLDLVTRPCEGCNEPRPFDPAWPATTCARCQAGGRRPQGVPQ